MLTRGLVAFVVAALMSTGLLVAPASAVSSQVTEVVAQVNQHRANAGLAALVSDPTLDAAAQAWAQHLASTGTFVHSTYDWRVSQISGAGWTNSGENIAAGYSTSSSVMAAWMGSAGHRANILNSSYTGIGVGYVQGGPYGYYWVQIFARSTAPRVPVGAAPVITGTAAIGETLAATTSGWPGGTTISWTWKADGLPIAGATSATYAPSLSDGGRRITAVATGSLPGYYGSSAISLPTSVVSGAPSSSRLWGADRYSAAVSFSSNGFSPGVDVVYVAVGTNFPDALSAGPAAAYSGAPLLLTPTGVLPDSVSDELRRLRPARIVVVGGPVSVSESVVAALQEIAPTTRISGSDRYVVSRAIVADTFPSADTVYIATGQNFPDALSATAAAGAIGAPVLLVSGSSASVDAATLGLLTDLGTTTIRIAGGVNSVSSGIQSQLRAAGYAVSRSSGADRYEAGATLNLNAFSSASTVYLASGANFPDALAGAALAGGAGMPLFLASPGCIPESVSRAITALRPTQIVLLGGPASLSAAVASYQRC
ncbi:MAG: cell wall-binding repeat-containing protein [Rhodoglobus sp.]